MSAPAVAEPLVLYKAPTVLYVVPDVGSERMNVEAQFTRSQISGLVGVDDGAVTFWTRERLLVPTSGGEGRGSHLKFDTYQVNIAAVLAELRKLGVNVGGLRSFATLLQRGTALALSAECNFWAIDNAIDLCGALARFHAGEPVTVYPNLADSERPDPWATDSATPEAFYEGIKHPAKTAEEVIAFVADPEGDNLHDVPEKIIAFAKRITPADFLPLQLFLELNGRAFRYVYEGSLLEYGDFEWLLVPQDDGGWEVFHGPEAHDLLGRATGTIRSGLFLAPGTIFRGVWGDAVQPILIHEPTPSRQRLARRARQKFMQTLARGGLTGAQAAAALAEAEALLEQARSEGADPDSAETRQKVAGRLAEILRTAHAARQRSPEGRA